MSYGRTCDLFQRDVETKQKPSSVSTSPGLFVGVIMGLDETSLEWGGLGWQDVENRTCLSAPVKKLHLTPESVLGGLRRGRGVTAAAFCSPVTGIRRSANTQDQRPASGLPAFRPGSIPNYHAASPRINIHRIRTSSSQGGGVVPWGS